MSDLRNKPNNKGKISSLGSLCSSGETYTIKKSKICSEYHNLHGSLPFLTMIEEKLKKFKYGVWNL